MLYQNNPTPEFRIRNPLQATIDDAERIIAQLHEVSEVLEEAIANERLWYGHYHDALESYELREIDALSEAIIMAQAKEGPLSGLATSSEAYKIALAKLKNDLRLGYLSAEWKAAQNVRRRWENAQIQLEQTQARFKALLKIVELKTGILRASTI